MNRRSFLSLIGSIPGLSYFVKADQAVVADAVPEPSLLIQPLRSDAPVIAGVTESSDGARWRAKITQPLHRPREYYVNDELVSREEFYRAFPELPQIY